MVLYRWHYALLVAELFALQQTSNDQIGIARAITADAAFN
jgi:hypothetical protein